MHNQDNRYRLSPEEIQMVINNRYGAQDFEEIPQWLVDMPDGKDENAEIRSIVGKTAILCDIHLGYHDITALQTAIRYIIKENVRNIVLNGDTIDAHKLSRWKKSSDDIEFTMELKLARNFLDNLKLTFPKCDIFFKLGNHEDRLENFILENASVFENIVSWDGLLELKRRNIHLVESLNLLECHGTLISHGHEVKVNGGKNPANALLTKANRNICMGHLHRTHTAVEKIAASNEYIRADVIGTLSKLQRKYAQYTQSNHGFAIIEEDGTMRNHTIDDTGKVN